MPRCAEPTCNSVLASSARPRRFCGLACKRRYQNRALKRSASLYEDLMHWRKARGRQKGQLGKIGGIVQFWLTEDRLMRERAAED